MIKSGETHGQGAEVVQIEAQVLAVQVPAKDTGSVPKNPIDALACLQVAGCAALYAITL